MDNEFPSYLKLKAPLKAIKLKCEKAQTYLKWDDLPTTREESNYGAKWWGGDENQ